MKRGSWILGLVVASLIVVSCSGIDLTSVVEDNPEDLVAINKLSGERADLFMQGLEGFCPEVDEDTVYRVQVIGDNRTITKVMNENGKVLCEVDTNDPNYAQKSVAVMVNDQPITLAEVQQALRSVPEQQRAQNAGNVINNLVNEVLLIQEANNRDITVSDQQVNAALEQTLNNSQVSPGQLGERDLNTLRQSIREQLKVQKMTQQFLAGQSFTVSDSEARNYYENNKENLTVSKSWQIRHIQVNFGDRGEEATREKARTVYNLLNQSDFCSLVSQFSDDTDSIERCGRYTFSSGDMAPAIEQEVKDMSVGETRIVQSQNAHHILQLEDVNEARQASYSEVEEQLKNFIQNQKRNQALADFIAELRNQSEIVSYLS